jgi:hypothetical protein
MDLNCGDKFSDPNFKIANGDIIRININKIHIFYGYIFTVNFQPNGQISIVAYDQIRYFAALDSRSFQNSTASDIIKAFATEFGLAIGEIDDTGYVIPSFVEENSKIIDIILKALSQTYLATGKKFTFYDNFGQLYLTNFSNMKLDLALTDASIVTNYDYSTSIDSDTYNYVKLIRYDKNSSSNVEVVKKDDDNIKKWGILQDFEKVDENLNNAQVTAIAENLLSLKNAETKSLTVDCLGVLGVRAGNLIYVNLTDCNLNGYFIVNKAIHKFENCKHIMTLEMSEWLT